MLLTQVVAGKVYVMQMSNFVLLLFAVLVIICGCDARSTIDGKSELIDNGETLVSDGENFEMGFFSEGLNRYVGIWYYKLRPRTVVWIANWNNSIRASTKNKESVSIVVHDGNLKILNSSNGDTYFSSGLDGNSSIRAELLDTGNLVLVDELGAKMWQSFQNPTNTFLPGMNMESLELTSWEGSGDRKYKFKVDQGDNKKYVIVENEVGIHWQGSVGGFEKSTAYEFFRFNDMPSFVTFFLSNNPVEATRTLFNNSVEATRTLFNNNRNFTPIDFSRLANFSNKDSIFKGTRLLMNSSGEIQFYFWDYESGWSLVWSAPKDKCDQFRKCGKFKICNSNESSECSCLPGFQSDSREDYGDGENLGGCSRISDNSCKEDTFVHLSSMKFGNSKWTDRKINTSENCMSHCLSDCSCKAYTYYNYSGCWFWESNLNLQENYPGGFNLSVRVPPTEVETQGGPWNNTPMQTSSRNQRPLVISLSVILGVMVLCGIIYIIYLKRVARSKAREIVLGVPMEYLPHRDSFDEDLITEDDKKRIDVPFFSFNSILVATENFSNASKLGRGGFGPVYKGKFLGGTDMAVKRLSSDSGQGVEEFKTEVMLIAKLQHRNLVRLLGYCVERNEKILLYEYMPNKSLDTFLFDHAFCRLLDWRIRFEIILGIARGLLYLHQDSRLRIIHRDLKTSNILLDEEMNAKISDFGLARIIEGKNTEANTNKVVGTYGYMSPEYAMEGLFSIKSDVFAFGVVLLEIISGRRNMEFFEDVNLIGHVWRLWMKDSALDMMDQTIVESCDESEVLKCVNVALLCVQEDPAERPVMSNVVFMLGGESITLPRPNQPAFIARRNSAGASTSSSSSKLYNNSNNGLTITQQVGR
ncbi:G-type lectin S-receptor-like serine/threonine-protein kinase At4g03230 isoform X2 [Solanum stenotomum]|uniref:G-type lectin S-receptor-like serine/threonine-protein kinase At4g03230 isoform X2 n=1 Tax=Solanum stenotomum TaxID=172797 RepID=UPI0020D183DE|nr:G-type lectin S-receptor-like serine/threonine-protein kinase At4g03230 isoform X2 [Solanum stenotomum]